MKSKNNNTSSLKKNLSLIPDKKRKLYFGNDEQKFQLYNSYFKNNTIRTTKYNIITWFPKSLLIQFFRAANIYFLIISILTLLPFSPKDPASMCGTFAAVLIFTMLKEGYEDIKRYQADKKINDKICYIYNYNKMKFEESKWWNIKVGNLIKIDNNSEVPADILLMKTSLSTGMCFLDTMNLDGETNLKNKMCFKNYIGIEDDVVTNLSGKIICDEADPNLNSWYAGIELYDDNQTVLNGKIDNLILKGCTLKNTEYILGIVIYSGHSTKIMKNAKPPKIKVSNVMKIMNILLYSLFGFLFALCLLYSGLFIWWQGHIGVNLKYLIYYDENNKVVHPPTGGLAWFLKFLTFIVAYSHIIPISFYVGVEVLKLFQMKLIASDPKMYDDNTNNNAMARTSDLIEELGQVEFVFSDKTGTLTKNEMVFKKCSINNVIYGESKESDKNKLSEEKDSDKYLLNGDSSCYKSLIDESDSQYIALNDFFTVCTVCHAAYIEEKEGKKVIQSSSPDEVALINGGNCVSYFFEKKTPGTIEIDIKYRNEYQKWNLLLELPFDSTRKRMSVFVHLDGTEEYWMFTKGADSEMLKAIDWNGKEDYLKIIYTHLKKFAKESLRTLVMAKKKVTKDEVYNYIREVEKIDTMVTVTPEDTKEKEELMSKLFTDIEKGFEYVGCSAIEDKLQDNVGQTIESLMKAKIKVWVLTGDKKETAIEIGKSCRLILSPKIMEQIDLANTSDETSDTCDEIKKKLDQWFYKFYNDKENEEINKKAKYSEKNLIKSAIDNNKKLYVIIDGKNLTHILADETMRRKFFRVGLLANSVICSRVSPAQKAEVVRLAQENGDWITLSIGDGANDVPMIMTANIGIGISGKEGTQAVRSSDYSIGQFQFLKNLLFTHGKWGYRRVSYFIYYYFYKNIVLVFVEMYFAFYSGFSGSLFFPDFLPLLYNAFWTSWPSMFCYCIERDVDYNLSMKLPLLYRAGQIKYFFNLKTFWKWMFFCLLHGAMIYYFGLLSLENSNGPDGITHDHWLNSTIIFSIIVHVVTYKIFIELKYWNFMNM